MRAPPGPAKSPVYRSQGLTAGGQNKGAKDGPRLSNWKSLHFLLFLAMGIMAAMAAGCGTGDPPGSSSPSGNSTNAEDSVVTVFAAASLTEAFNAIAEEYRTLHPASEVLLIFDGSQRLRTQLEHGAQADIFASADWDQMAEVEALGLTVAPPVNFASNRLAVLVYTGSRGRLNSEAFGTLSHSPDAFWTYLEPLATPGTRIVLGQPEVPIGRYTEEMLKKVAAHSALGPKLEERVLANVVSREASIRGILQKVNLGEADAGVVYSSDARMVRGAVRVLELPDSVNVAARYPIAAMTRESGSAAFLDFVLSESGQEILSSYGFGSPLETGGDAP